MTDSDSLRGDHRSEQDRINYSDVQEFNTLRALLRPRMTATGDPTSTDALRGMIVEIERLDGESRRLQSRLAQVGESTEALAARGAALNMLGWTSNVDPVEWAKTKARELSNTWTTIDHDCRKNAFASQYAAERVQAHIEHAERRVAEAEGQASALRQKVDELTDQIEEMGVALDETALNAKARRAALVSLGWDGEGNPEAWAKNWWSATPFSGVAERLRDIMSTCFGGSRSGDLFFQVADMEKWIPKFTSEWTANHGRWLKLCEAFGFDPEEDPPASIPAILAGDRWTNTRRMLADACAKLRAPSLEVILGELVNAVTKAHGVSTDTLFGRTPATPRITVPKLDEPCHVRKNLLSRSAQHVDIIAQRNALADSVRELDGRLLQTTHECTGLRTALAERNARVHQLEIDNSKVHLEGRIEIAEKRVATWRAWVVGMCPADLAHDNMSDDGLRAFMIYVPASALDNVQAKLRDALDGLDNWRIWAESFGVCPVGSSVADLQGAIRASWDRLRARNEKLIGLVDVLRGIKHQLIALADLSP